MKKNSPCIVLVRPQLPENIGMVARAMDNCGLSKLILVSPREKWPNKKSIESSTNSKNILKNVKVYNTLNKALTSFHFVIATSSRQRFLQKPVNDNFNNLMNKIPLGKKIAFVFGPENSGLSNDDLMLCDIVFNIKLSKTNKSLNLSHAVFFISYKWREYFENIKKINTSDKIKNNIALKKDFHFFMNFLYQQLEEVGFLQPKHKSKIMFNNIQTMFLRSRLSRTEIQTLWGMIKKLRNRVQNR